MENNTQQTGEQQKVDAQPFEPAHEKNVGMAVVAYLLFFVPLLTESKNDPFVKYHVKQGFVLFITAVAVNIVAMFLHEIFFGFVGVLLQLGVFVLLILGILNAVHGKKEPLPLVGQYADKFTF